VIGVIFLSVGVAGYLFQWLGWTKRILMITAGLLLIPSSSTSLWLGANAAGILLGVALVIAEWSSASKHAINIANVDQS
jgi:TRAP-type uncharacterized transport system fused permease subunit